MQQFVSAIIFYIEFLSLNFQISYVFLCFSNIFKFPVFSLSGITFHHFPCFACGVGTLRKNAAVAKVEATPYFSVSVPVSVFSTCVRRFKLYLTTILCPFSDGLALIWRDYTLY